MTQVVEILPHERQEAYLSNTVNTIATDDLAT